MEEELIRVGNTNCFISFDDFDKWFIDKGLVGAYMIDAKSAPEKKHRLIWLSEGSLIYHMTQFKSKMPHGGCPLEKKLYKEFLDFCKK